MKKYLTLLTALLLASSAHAADFTFSNDLRVGGRGQDVIELQGFLISNGYDIPFISAGTVQKGYFGLQTKSAVQKYQADQGLPSTGFVGPLTRGKLNNRGIISSLNLISPNGGEVWRRGTTQTIKWNAPAYFRATYAEIKLLPYYPPCTGQVCPMYSYPYLAPYTIVTGISIDNHLYSWKVGDVVYPALAPNQGVPAPIPDGQYTIQICETGTNNCASSNKPFTITSNTTSNLPPVINGIDAPTALNVGQMGTWTVRATDPENSSLSYAVNWGDMPEAYISSNAGTSIINSAFTQNTTFSHSYTSTGIYTVKFTVQDNTGNQIQSSMTVQVTGSIPTITVLSPNGGENWMSKSVQPIRWSYRNASVNSKVDLYLTQWLACPSSNGQGCTTIFDLDKNIDANSIYNWIVGTDIVNNSINNLGNYYVKVCVAGTTDCDQSDAYFTLAPQIQY